MLSEYDNASCREAKNICGFTEKGMAKKGSQKTYDKFTFHLTTISPIPMTIHQNSLQNFLSKLSVIEFKYQTITDNKEQFNIFTALHKPNDEVRLHSRFISVLLSPFSNHKRGDAFLKRFLQVLQVEDFDTKGAVVYPEEHLKTEYCNIDILILNRASKQAIIIENKIGAGDSNHEDRGQLEGYFNQVIKNEKIPGGNIKVFYLTLDRHLPSEESLGNYKTLENMNGRAIDYEHEINEWLNLCLAECVQTPFLRESITQYLNLIKQMTHNVDISERLEIRDLFSSSSDNMKAAKLMMDNFKHVKWHTVAEFWDELALELEAKGMTISEKPTHEQIVNITHYEYYKKSYQSNASCGLYVKTKNDLELFVWNGTGEDWLYWGLRKSELLPGNLEKVDRYVLDNPGYFKERETYFYRDFDLPYDENIFFPNFSYDGTFNLINREYRQNIIKKKLVPEIIKFLQDSQLEFDKHENQNIITIN